MYTNFIAPMLKLQNVFLYSFYRYVVEPEVQFLPNGKQSEGPIAKFNGLPANPLLTQNLQVKSAIEYSSHLTIECPVGSRELAG